MGIEVNINVNITGLEGLAESIKMLAEKMPAKSTPVGNAPGVLTPDQAANAATQPVDGPEQNISPMQNPAPTQNFAQNFAQNAAPVQPVATSAATYTLNDIANAAMTLMDSGRQPELVQLLAGFGVEALPALPQERYAEFATALRGLGARI